MPGNIFYRLDPLLICLVLIGVLIAAVEIGLWAKRRVKAGSDNIEKADVALILGAVLTLVALLLGFTYAMSEGRFGTRRQAGYRRGQCNRDHLSPGKGVAGAYEFSDSGITAPIYGAPGRNRQHGERHSGKIREADNRSKQLHGLIWSHAAAMARENPNPVISIFLETLNEMIDLHSNRLAEFWNRVPFSIYLVLFVVSIIALWLVGYYFGTRRQRARILTTMVALLVASVMWLIMDLDQPVRGAIKASQQSLFDLHQDLNQESKDAIKKSF